MKQEELVYNANFKLQQMEKKVARGLGERSDEEKKELLHQTDELTKERDSLQEKDRYLSQQCKILQQELKKWQRKLKTYVTNEAKIDEDIAEVNLEISSCEINLQKMIKEKEECMVSHDLVRLEIRRLRDTLKKKTEDVYKLQQLHDSITDKMNQRKAELKALTEVKVAQLRAVEEDRHKSKIELGQRSIAAQKMKLKYEMITKAHHTDGEQGEEHSHVYSLIAVAQKRADLQREGDELDLHIRKKEKELKALRKSLAQLKERNTDFRLSFTKVDPSSIEYKNIRTLEEQVESSEKAMLEAKKDLNDTQRRCDKEERKLHNLQKKLAELKEDNIVMESKKIEIEEAIASLSRKAEILQENIEHER